jgi:3-oxoacyl-[acyl-carrier protein] reductase
MPNNEFQGKTALITGASRGIGAATAVALAQAGVPKLILHYNSYGPGVEQVLSQVRALGAEASALQADLGTTAGIDGFLAALGPKPAVDILINNAGSLVRRASLVEFTDELYDRVMNLNARSAWRISQAAAPHMIDRGWGIVVFLSSIAARTGGGPGATIYSAAKACVACMTKGVARELAPKGIRVNALSPGTVDNYFHEQFSTPEVLAGVVKATPAGRLATNEEMADVILFLCSHAARYVFGQTIELNGGFYMI